MNKIDRVLTELSVSPCLLGFEYLRSALIMLSKEPTMIRDITKRLYPEIANRHGSTAPRVERSIRHAIENSWAQMQPEYKKKYFVVDRIKNPKNSDYIATLMLHFKEESTEIGSDFNAES